MPAYLRNAAVKGACILVITHDQEFINNVADSELAIAGDYYAGDNGNF
ncbi:MAG: hypothetical protein K6E12_05290 [Saccharofermentans sp.]|nr:hypothetical protein [Saccharofermentans sp.]